MNMRQKYDNKEVRVLLIGDILRYTSRSYYKWFSQALAHRCVLSLPGTTWTDEIITYILD